MPKRRASDFEASTVIKVDASKLDNLIDMVGELVIIQSMIRQDPTLANLIQSKLSQNLSQLNRITSSLQKDAMSLRMVPVRQTFQKMSRLVRDLGSKSGKKVELALYGEDTEMDRKMVEEINDPLMHMIRNAVDHGIEKPATRAERNKPATARVELKAYHQGGNIVIEISDDGNGLDPEKIRKQGDFPGVDHGRTGIERSRDFSTHLRARVLDGREDHRDLGTWCREWMWCDATSKLCAGRLKSNQFWAKVPSS